MAVAVAVALGAYAVVKGRGLGGEPEPHPETYVSGYEVVRSYPHDSSMFTQGLVFTEDGQLYESDGLYRHSVVRHIDVESGKSLKTFKNPDNVRRARPRRAAAPRPTHRRAARRRSSARASRCTAAS